MGANRLFWRVSSIRRRESTRFWNLLVLWAALLGVMLTFLVLVLVPVWAGLNALFGDVRGTGIWEILAFAAALGYGAPRTARVWCAIGLIGFLSWASRRWQNTPDAYIGMFTLPGLQCARALCPDNKL